MKHAVPAALLLLASLTVSAPLLADTTMAYPSADNASFLIDYPDHWTMEPGESVGDYSTLTGPNGTTLWFRTVDGNKEALQQAMVDTGEWLKEHYTDIEVSDPTPAAQHGLSGFQATAAGTDEDGNRVGFALAWMDLKDGNIGEIAFATFGDEAEVKQAGAILNSFRSP